MTTRIKKRHKTSAPPSRVALPMFDETRDPPRMAPGLIGGLLRGERDDPSDVNPLSGLKLGTKPRQVFGYRKWSVIDDLHTRNPRQLTREHLEAAERYLSDAELAAGSMGGWQPERVASSPAWLRSPAQVALDATERLRQARDRVGVMGTACLNAVVLDNLSIAGWSEIKGVREEVGKGLLLGVLELLAEHYGIA